MNEYSICAELRFLWQRTRCAEEEERKRGREGGAKKEGEKAQRNSQFERPCDLVILKRGDEELRQGHRGIASSVRGSNSEDLRHTVTVECGELGVSMPLGGIVVLGGVVALGSNDGSEVFRHVQATKQGESTKEMVVVELSTNYDQHWRTVGLAEPAQPWRFGACIETEIALVLSAMVGQQAPCDYLATGLVSVAGVRTEAFYTKRVHPLSALPHPKSPPLRPHVLRQPLRVPITATLFPIAAAASRLTSSASQITSSPVSLPPHLSPPPEAGPPVPPLVTSDKLQT
ncbi:hypothetical protein B0H14DRAFT_2611880 [Mycena olivaceomarginata]|nr:hypothetical protein B0H14DRAFT_2611880 [Mycena olivaceomarginata]